MRNSLTAGSRLTSTAAIVAILMFSAILVPAASAQPVDAPGQYLANYPSQTAPAPTHATATDGFDWGDAAIGACLLYTSDAADE